MDTRTDERTVAWTPARPDRPLDQPRSFLLYLCLSLNTKSALLNGRVFDLHGRPSWGVDCGGGSGTDHGESSSTTVHSCKIELIIHSVSRPVGLLMNSKMLAADLNMLSSSSTL